MSSPSSFGPRPLLVVDGDSLAHRAFHAMPRVTGTDDRPVGATLGFANMLLTVWDAYPSRAVVVALDSRELGYRNELLPPYQGQRAAFDPDLVAQLDDLPDFLGAFGIEAPRVSGYEADDVLATVATKEEAGGGSCLILTSDRDAYQLVSERVHVLRPTTGVRNLERVDPAGVVERYGVLPAQVVDLIALRGDPSDNIPGARGIGPKTAAGLLQRHGDLEGVLAASGRFGDEAREELKLYYRVASMQRDLDVEPPLDREPDWIAGAAAARQRGMGRLADRLEARVAAP